jgi:hypothetical protein
MRSYAPWDEDQVKSLGGYQAHGSVHEYTCPHDHPERTLVATAAGLICHVCEYKQTWAFSWTTDWTWLKSIEQLRETLQLENRL